MLLSAIAALAAESPSRPALLFAKRETYVQLSYGDLVEEMERWARRYLSLGLPPRSTIAIVLDHRIEAYGAYLGAMRAGFVPAFLAYPTPKQKEALFWPAQRQILASLEPSCVVTYGKISERVAAAAAGLRYTALDIENGLPDARGALPPIDRIEANETVALLQLSSGTTGARKSIALTYGQIAAQLEALQAALPATGAERTLSWAPLYHDMGLITAFLLPFSIGSSVVALDAFEWLARPSMYLEFVERFAITDAWLPNFAMNHLVRTYDPSDAYDLSSVRTIVSVAEAIREETLDAFARTFARLGLRAEALRCAWGLAENVLLCTITRPGEPRRTASVASGDRPYLSVGPPLPGVEIAIAPGSTDGVGEIAVRGRCAIDGYYRNSEATAEVLRDGWLRTGDLGFILDGDVYVCGRIKEILIVNGRNFYASDIEAIVSAVPGIKPGRSVAFARYDAASATEEAVVLAETLPDSFADAATLAREIRSAIYGGLALHVGTVELLAAGELVKTTSGKMSRAKNASLFASGELVASS